MLYDFSKYARPQRSSCQYSVSSREEPSPIVTEDCSTHVVIRQASICCPYQRRPPAREDRLPGRDGLEEVVINGHGARDGDLAGRSIPFVWQQGRAGSTTVRRESAIFSKPTLNSAGPHRSSLPFRNPKLLTSNVPCTHTQSNKLARVHRPVFGCWRMPYMSGPIILK